MAPGPEGLIYVISRASYAVINTNVKTSRPTPFTLPQRETSAVVGADGKHLYVVGNSGSDDAIRVVEVSSHQVVGTLAANLGVAVDLAVSKDGRRMYATNFYREGIIVLDGAGPKEVGMIEIGR
ncbi:hypothetical protein OG474_01310 [Kribbella sp. NBC_01505]|uniref:YncE family protein n=1 Tax=Kribbella sp. NBC_01505 TaxID=2903580 RepID=UPI003870C2FD